MYTLPISFFLWTLIGQIIGVSIGLFIICVSHSNILSLCVVALVTLFFARKNNMPLAWQALNFLLPFAFLLSSNIEIPSWIFLTAFIIFAMFHLPALWTRVPYYPTPDITYQYVFGLLPHEKDFRFIDVGCGMGDLLKFLAARSKTGNFVGVEIGILSFLISKIKNLSNQNVSVFFKSMWKMNLAEFDVIYAFLSPAPMEQLWNKFIAEAKPGALLVSNSFEAPAEPDNIIETGPERGGTLYLYYKTGRSLQIL